MTVEDAAPAETPSNSDRLLKHLKEDALSTRLVQTHRDTRGDIGSLKKVIAERLDQVRQDLVSKD
ncbi:MAG: hypothetical protein KIS68_03635 [Bauldia sp.]|nr:hypothetical protein [Bauldia sp.]